MTETPKIWTPDYWRARAQDMRDAARAHQNREHKDTLLRIADLYEQLAHGHAGQNGFRASAAKKAERSSDPRK
jgi:hypothetical protein